MGRCKYCGKVKPIEAELHICFECLEPRYQVMAAIKSREIMGVS